MTHPIHPQRRGLARCWAVTRLLHPQRRSLDTVRDWAKGHCVVIPQGRHRKGHSPRAANRHGAEVGAGHQGHQRGTGSGPK